MLKLPLKYYDESGRILPPRWLYALLLLLCADWALFIFSLASRSHTDTLLHFFYPHSKSLLFALVTSVPALLSLLLLSQRERLWKKGLISWRRWFIPLLLCGVVALLTSQVVYAITHHWAFELITAIRLVLSIIALYTIAKSRHLRWMVDDWEHPNIQADSKENVK